MNQPWGFALLAFFVISSVLMVAWMLKIEHRLARIKRERATALGFTPLTHPDQALVEKILALYPLRPGQRRELRHLYTRRSLHAELVMFDLYSVKGESTTLLAEGAIAAVFDAPDGLPRFPSLTIMPRMEGDMPQTRSNPWLLAMALAGQRVIAFPDVPVFTQRFSVLINEGNPALTFRQENQVRRFLSPNMRVCLSQLDPLQIVAYDNLLAVSNLDIALADEECKLEQLRRLIDGTMMIAGWFESESLRGHGSAAASDPSPTLPLRIPASELAAAPPAAPLPSSVSAPAAADAPGTGAVEAPFANGFVYRVTTSRPAAPPSPAD